MMIMRRLACCSRDRRISLDFDEQERVRTYDGLESCILNSHSFDNESGASRWDECNTDSLDEDKSSCSSGNAFKSFSTQWTMKRDEEGADAWECIERPKHFRVKEKPAYSVHLLDMETMKERFAKLLLGEDITGGNKGLSTALALSNAITNLAASVFGELWKLQPLPEERKSKWRKEMDLLLSPTNYMIELVPAKQHGADGQTMEIMTPKARADIHMNLPALQKLDSMLNETLDSMVDTEFWYVEGGSQTEGRSEGARQSRKWWHPFPQVPEDGLSGTERMKLLNLSKLVHQVFKAAKSVNENVLIEMPIPKIIRDALPKSGKACLGEKLYRILTTESKSVDELVQSLDLNSEHSVLEAINRLEAAIFAWKEKISEQDSHRSPVRTSLSFLKDPISELDKTERLLERAEALRQQFKSKYPNLPRTFLDVAKIRYGKDVGHSILEAYSRVLGNLAFSILSRVADILQEDVFRNPDSPIAGPACLFSGMNLPKNSDPSVISRTRHSLIVDQMHSAGRKEKITTQMLLIQKH